MAKFRVSAGQDGWRVLSIETEQGVIVITGDAAELSNQLMEAANKLRPKRILDEQSITPDEVIEYFRHSPVLKEYADDLEDTLRASRKRTASNHDTALLLGHREKLLDAAGKARRGAVALAAEILFGSREKTGGSYLRRIHDALNNLKEMEM